MMALDVDITCSYSTKGCTTFEQDSSIIKKVNEKWNLVIIIDSVKSTHGNFESPVVDACIVSIKQQKPS